MKRREFLRGGAIAATGLMGIAAGAARGDVAVSGKSVPKQRTRVVPSDSADWLWKTLKIGMIRGGETLQEKFMIAKQAGFHGVELDAPGIDLAQAKAAAASTGLIIDGTVGGYHWDTRHTDPDPAVRAEALKLLREGLRQTAAVGGDTMLLVPGHGKDGSPQEVTAHAAAAIGEVLPLAVELDVKILIENVWNHFLYDHQGGSDQTADALAAFVDSFQSPYVGVQYDIGNHWKYGDPAAWVRTLGDRIVKLDIKGFSRAEDRFTAITQGDIDWPSVKAALREIGFRGWLAAEVEGGGLTELREIALQMDVALDCDESITQGG